MKAFSLHLLLVTIIFISVVETQRWGPKSYTNKQVAKTGYGVYGPYGYNGASTQPTTSLKVQRAYRGIGAWGYIAIILTVLLSGLGVYYFVLFYPIVCKKERKYDVMEMTAV